MQMADQQDMIGARATALRETLRQLRDELKACRHVGLEGFQHQLQRLTGLCDAALAQLPPAAASSAVTSKSASLRLDTWLPAVRDELCPDITDIELQLAQDLPAVEIDEHELLAALRDLALLARSHGATRLQISARRHNLSLAELAPDVEPGEYLSISLTDDGSTERPLAHTQHGDGRGTAANQLARKHGGMLRLSTRRGQGPRLRSVCPWPNLCRCCTYRRRVLSRGHVLCWSSMTSPTLVRLHGAC